MSKILVFEIRFRGPFLVGGDPAGDGSDIRVNRDVLIPGSSIKGRLRAEATNTLRLPDALIGDVFGTSSQGGKWWFSQVDFSRSDLHVCTSNRVAMDPESPDSGITDDHQLVFYDQCWADFATFTVEQLEYIDDVLLQKHIAVLCSAARSTASLGAMRRRGHGWVTIVPQFIDEMEVFRSLRELQK